MKNKPDQNLSWGHDIFQEENTLLVFLENITKKSQICLSNQNQLHNFIVCSSENVWKGLSLKEACFQTPSVQFNVWTQISGSSDPTRMQEKHLCLMRIPLLVFQVCFSLDCLWSFPTSINSSSFSRLTFFLWFICFNDFHFYLQSQHFQHKLSPANFRRLNGAMAPSCSRSLSTQDQILHLIFS